MDDSKIKTREEIASIARELKQQGKIIGFTSGVFDILHSGHVYYLKEARKKCDCLIVGVNSDKSAKGYKGDDRPIVSESERVKIISSLESVDYVFLFDEMKNKENLEAIKPDLYIKAGDYKPCELTSTKYLEPWGGRAVLIPIEENVSTSKIIDKVLKMQGEEKISTQIVSLDKKPLEKSSAIFLDRDGVINEDVHFLHEPEKFKLLPNVLEGLKKMQDMKYKLIIVTTQGGIGLGYFTKEDFFRVNSEMLRQFSVNGIKIDKIYFCPHSLSEDCDCRKPKIGLFERAKQELGIDMGRSFTIGDKTSDILAGKNAGTKTILMKTGYAGADREFNVDSNYVAEDLIDAANFINRNEGIDFSKIKTYPIRERLTSLESVENFAKLNDEVEIIDSDEFREFIERVASAHRNNKKIIVMIGGHVVKTGMTPYLIDLMKRGVISHIAMNSAASIHDFEIALVGKTSEDVLASIADGKFGMVEETGSIINKTLKKAADKDLGWGHALGKEIFDSNLVYKDYSLLYHAHKLGIPLTVHAAIGTDIINQHPECDGAALGKTSYKDFKTFTESVSKLGEGVIMNFGSAVIMPEVFLKVITIVRNLGYEVRDITAASFDQIDHYRPRMNVVERPVSALGGKGFIFLEKHQKSIPSVYKKLIEKLS